MRGFFFGLIVGFFGVLALWYACSTGLLDDYLPSEDTPTGEATEAETIPAETNGDSEDETRVEVTPEPIDGGGTASEGGETGEGDTTDSEGSADTDETEQPTHPPIEFDNPTPVNFVIKRVLLESGDAQKTDSWCWATSGAMVMNYHLAENIDQCDLVNERFPGENCHCDHCSASQPSSPCVQGGWPDFEAFEFDAKIHNQGARSPGSETAVPWERLKEEIDADRPFVFAWAWEGGGGHMMVVAGYIEHNDGRRMVWILDPMDPCEGSSRWITYRRYVRDFGEYEHWRAQLEIQPKEES